MRDLFVALAMAALSAVPAAAQDAKPSSSLMSWLKNWKNSLERSAVEGRYRKMRTATAVAAVRGGPQEAANAQKVYWKGGWSEKREAERAKERKELAAAVTLMMDGKEPEAREALDAFEKAHPQSSFLPDVAEARAKLDEGKPKPAAPEPAKEPEAKKPEAAPAEPAKAEPAKAEPPKPEAPATTEKAP